MSIDSVNGSRTYDPTQFSATGGTSETAKTGGPNFADPSLLNAVGKGSVLGASDEAATDTPPLDPPKSNPTPTDYYSCSGLPSPGAAMMATMVESTAEERRDNAELRIQQSDVIVDQIHAQADEMRANAGKQLAMGIVSGAISIGSAIAGSVVLGKSMHAASKCDLNNVNDKGAFDTIMTKQQGINSNMGQFASGVAGLVDAGAKYADTMSQARIKDMDAEIEQQRAFRDILQSLDEALSQQISKTLSTMENIQSDMNETRKRIVG